MAFHDVRFPADLSFGSVGGPERRTEIVTLANGHEERNSPWADSRRRYDAGIGMRSLDDVAAMDGVLRGALGRAACVPVEGLGGLQVVPAIGHARAGRPGDRDG